MIEEALTIPSEIRKHLDLKAGDYISFKITNEGKS